MNTRRQDVVSGTSDSQEVSQIASSRYPYILARKISR